MNSIVFYLFRRLAAVFFDKAALAPAHTGAFLNERVGMREAAVAAVVRDRAVHLAIGPAETAVAKAQTVVRIEKRALRPAVSMAVDRTGLFASLAEEARLAFAAAFSGYQLLGGLAPVLARAVLFATVASEALRAGTFAWIPFFVESIII